MAQHIGCIKQDENGVLIEDSDLNFAIINELLWELDSKKEKYPWLLTIPPYADATFNDLQRPYIVAELKKLSFEVNSDLIPIIDSLIAFIESVNSPHIYITFVGD